jgi:hypothetical protein
MLMPVRQDADHAQYRNAHYSSGTPHTKGKAIKVDVDHVEVGERTRPPRLQVVPSAWLRRATRRSWRAGYS